MADALSAICSTGMAGFRRSIDNLRQEARTVTRPAVEGATADLSGALARRHPPAEPAETASPRSAPRRGSVIDVLA